MLKDTHIIVKSCNKDESLYFVPIGTEDEITYSSKPENSYRYSDHWNWYANAKKCSNEKYIQCFTRDMPWCRRRQAPEKGTNPIFGICICYFKDNEYHSIYGEKFNRKSKEWTWEDNLSSSQK